MYKRMALILIVAFIAFAPPASASARWYDASSVMIDDFIISTETGYNSSLTQNSNIYGGTAAECAAWLGTTATNNYDYGFKVASTNFTNTTPLNLLIDSTQYQAIRYNNTVFSITPPSSFYATGQTCIPTGSYLVGGSQPTYVLVLRAVDYSSGITLYPNAPPVADYTCNIDPTYPTKGNPFALSCTDNSTAHPALTSYEWNLTQPDGSTYLTTASSLSKTLNQDGWYGLQYKACNSEGCGYKNTTQLVNVTSGYIPTTSISFWVHIYDPLKSAKIAGSSLRVTNTTSISSFRDITSTSGSFLIDSTVAGGFEPITAGQYVNLTGSATGYQTANQTVTVPYDGWEYNLNLVATSDVPTGANATLVVNVINTYTAESIDGATITISNNTIPYSSSMLSNAGGSATFASIPAGRYQISASKTGYQSSTTTWNTAGSVVTTAYIGILPVGATPVVTGTAGNPLFDADGNPIVGYDADGNPITAAPTQDTRTAAEKDAGMMDLLRNNGEALIMLFIVFTIIYMIKGIGR